jgi:hypothetical protein
MKDVFALIGPQGLQHFNPVYSRHLEIEQYERWQPAGSMLECPLTEHIFETLEPITDPLDDIDQVSLAQRTEGQLCVVIIVLDK